MPTQTHADRWEIVDRGTDREAIERHTTLTRTSPVTIEYYLDAADPHDVGWSWRIDRGDLGQESSEADDRWWASLPDVPAHIQKHAESMEARLESLRDSDAVGRPSRGAVMIELRPHRLLVQVVDREDGLSAMISVDRGGHVEIVQPPLDDHCDECLTTSRQERASVVDALTDADVVRAGQVGREDYELFVTENVERMLEATWKQFDRVGKGTT